jgi:LmbE family N-acetylglucosaminyl deacetylase
MPTMATIVAFHAHPDDEVLLTEGHRVIVVVASDRVIGPADGPGGQTRLAELRASAALRPPWRQWPPGPRKDACR